MNCQFIDYKEHQLYSVYHEPSDYGDSNIGVLLCNPLGQEYVRCHKLYVNLANRLAQEGCHVLRFDYLGTGDSSGNFNSFSLVEGTNNIETMANELRDTFDVSRVILIGVRMGATMSILHACKNSIDGMALIHPIFTGDDYIQNIKGEYQKWLDGSFTKEKTDIEGSFSSFGFKYSEELTEELESIQIDQRHFISDTKVLLIGEDKPKWLEGLSQLRYEPSSTNEFWMKKSREADKSMVPLIELNQIMDWLTSQL